METVRIYRLNNLPRSITVRLRNAQMEAAKVWNLCRDIHLGARRNKSEWPKRDELQKAAKGGQFALHSQTVQMVCHAFLANVETTRQVKKTNPKIRYPYKDKRYYPLYWPAQALSRTPGRIVLPMGRGRRSIVLRIDAPDTIGGCKICWNDGYELHLSVPATPASQAPGSYHATADLGQIHQVAVAADTGEALVVSGRAVRSAKRWLNKELGEIAKKRCRCKKGSRRWRKLQQARRKTSAKIERQVRDLRHKGTRKAIDFCIKQGVGALYIGNPDGVRAKPAGRHHNQRMSQWEYGRDIDYLTHKSEHGRIMCFTGTERGTSSQCPECGHRQKPKGREWRCRVCGFAGHRDVVGAVNMHKIAFAQKIAFPQRITYLRPGPARVRVRDEQPRPVARAGT